MRCTFLDENGKAQQAVMGCYGIGIGRTAASAIEQGHDDRGIIWPIPLAPYHVVIVPAGKPGGAEEVKAQEIYEQLRGLGVEVVFDDRKERPGVKFADADLVGYPIRITVGKRSLAENAAELKLRAEADVTLVPLEEVSARVQQIITEALRDDA